MEHPKWGAGDPGSRDLNTILYNLYGDPFGNALDHFLTTCLVYVLGRPETIFVPFPMEYPVGDTDTGTDTEGKRTDEKVNSGMSRQWLKHFRD